MQLILITNNYTQETKSYEKKIKNHTIYRKLNNRKFVLYNNK